MKNEHENKTEKEEWLNNITVDLCYHVLKYGLRGTDCPPDITVEDMFNAIGCLWAQGNDQY